MCTSYNSVQVVKESFIGSDVVGVVRFDEIKNKVDDVLDWSSESIGEHASRSNHQQQHSEHRHNDALKHHKYKRSRVILAYHDKKHIAGVDGETTREETVEH